jgi:16S rRNA (cytosine1402-N4)-methyltransferase
MRFDPSTGLSAAELLNTLSEKEIAEILWKFGDEQRSRQIAKEIVRVRPIQTTEELVVAIKKAYRGKRGKKHPATQSFQAIRIAVNGELVNLRDGLEKGLKILALGGRFTIITFHSIEDRIVKDFFRKESTDCVCPPEQILCNCEHEASLKRITKKPIEPSQEEIGENPRARSAKLRVAEKI